LRVPDAPPAFPFEIGPGHVKAAWPIDLPDGHTSFEQDARIVERLVFRIES
jgi:hypothetical protein